MTLLVLLAVLMAAVLVAAGYFAKATVLDFEQRADADVFRVKESYLAIIRQKDELAAEKHWLQEETERIFSRYALMKALVRSADADTAFQVFRDHLRGQVELEECHLVDKHPGDIGSFPSFAGYRFFPLRARNIELGELAHRGLAPRDEETFQVLARQFALALRRIRLRRELEELAVTDGLTRLHTRRHLMERFREETDRARARGRSLAVMMIDVDHFKRVNDRHGHLVGDQVLREIGRIIRQQIRGIDIAGRYGGEEFCVVLPDTDKAGAVAVAERIRAAADGAEIRAFDAILSVSLSIGTAVFPADAASMEDLLEKADWALYRAKKTGRNRVISPP